MTIGVNLMPNFVDFGIFDAETEYENKVEEDLPRYRCLNISQNPVKFQNSKTVQKNYTKTKSIPPDPKQILNPNSNLPKQASFLPNDRILSDAQRNLAEKLAGMIENVETRNKLIREQLVVQKDYKEELKMKNRGNRPSFSQETDTGRSFSPPVSVSPFKFDSRPPSYRLGAIAKREISNSGIKSVGYQSNVSLDNYSPLSFKSSVNREVSKSNISYRNKLN